jgi:hypothetical protein
MLVTRWVAQRKRDASAVAVEEEKERIRKQEKELVEEEQRRVKALQNRVKVLQKHVMKKQEFVKVEQKRVEVVMKHVKMVQKRAKKEKERLQEEQERVVKALQDSVKEEKKNVKAEQKRADDARAHVSLLLGQLERATRRVAGTNSGSGRSEHSSTHTQYHSVLVGRYAPGRLHVDSVQQVFQKVLPTFKSLLSQVGTFVSELEDVLLPVKGFR